MAALPHRAAGRPEGVRPAELAAPLLVGLLALLLLLPLQTAALSLPGMDEEQVRYVQTSALQASCHHVSSPLTASWIRWRAAPSLQPPPLDPPAWGGALLSSGPPPSWYFGGFTMQTITQEDPAVTKLKGMLDELREKAGRRGSNALRLWSLVCALVPAAWGAAACGLSSLPFLPSCRCHDVEPPKLDALPSHSSACVSTCWPLPPPRPPQQVGDNPSDFKSLLEMGALLSTLDELAPDGGGRVPEALDAYRRALDMAKDPQASMFFTVRGWWAVCLGDACWRRSQHPWGSTH